MLTPKKRNTVVAALATVSLTGGLGLLATGAMAADPQTGVAISALSVTKGASTATTNLLVTGTGFSKLATPGVKFGDTAVTTLIVLSDTQIAVVAPAAAEGVTGKVDVTLTDTDTVYPALSGATAAKDDFTYLVPYNATVAAGSLMNSVGGSKLKVTSSADMGACGTAFTGNKVTASIAGVNAVVTCVDSTNVSLAVPAGVPSADAVKVVLFHDGVPGTASTVAKYAAVVSGIDKPIGSFAGGETVAITGKGLTGATAWKFGTQDATCTAAAAPAADTKVTCTVPAPAGADADPSTATPGAVSVSFTPATAPYGMTSKATYTYSDLG